MKKRFLSIFLALVMCLTLLPTMALAKSYRTYYVDDDSGSDSYTQEFDGGKYAGDSDHPLKTIAKALEKAGNGDTIMLLSDITENVNITKKDEQANRTITLDLNGHVLKGDGTASVITVGTGVTLTLTDSNSTTEHAGYVDANGLWHWDKDSSHELETGEAAETVTGGVITGGKNEFGNGGGVFISLGGTFIMNGGNIVGNTADNGGGVSNSGTFTMSGGTITGNTAQNGGGIYAASITGSESTNILVGGTITGNTANAGGGLYYQEEMCFVAGTPITMADGSRKPIETLKIGDVVRVFDHDTGTISTAKLFDLWKYPEKHSGAVTLHFSHGIDVTVVYGHSFFDREANKYVSVSRDNVDFYVGHDFYNVDNGHWETLIGYDFLDGEVDTYVITSEKHLNCVANGMLSNEDGLYTTLTNVFEYGDGLKINAEKKADDLERYGLFGYEELQYVSREVYDILNFQYLNVAFGKGMITKDAFLSLEAYWAAVDPELLCGTAVQQGVDDAGEAYFEASATSVQNGGLILDPGVYLGGTIKITGNKVDGVENNLYLPSGKYVTIGDGKSVKEGGNGVAVPDIEGDDKMNIGVTTASGTGAFTTNGTEGDAEYFFSDDPANHVEYKDSVLKLVSGSNWKLLNDALSAESPSSVSGVFRVNDTNPLDITLLTDITAGTSDTTLTIPENKTVTLRLDGHTIDRNLSEAVENGGVITVNSGATLGVLGTGTITGGNTTGDGGGINNSGTLTLIGVTVDGNKAANGGGIYNTGTLNTLYYANTISNNTASENGGGIYTTGGTLNLYYPTTIENNKATNKGGGIYAANYVDFRSTTTVTGCEAKNGGGVYVVNNGWVEDVGGKITDNTASENGGGVYIEHGGKATFGNSASVTGNKAVNGGGIYSKGAIGLETATISGNTVTSGNGGGIYLSGGTEEADKGSIFLGKDAKVKDNTNNNLYLCDNILLAKFGTGEDVQTPTSNMSIGVTTATAPTAGNPVKLTENGTEDYKGYITPDHTDYEAAFDTDHLVLQAKPTPPAPSGGGSAPTVTVPVVGDKDSVKISATVSGSNATVKNVTAEQIAKVGTGANVTVDLSGLSKSVTGVTLPKTTFENVAASDADGLEVKLPNGTTAVFDSATVAAVAEQAAGSNIQLVVDKESKAEQALNAAQKETVKALNDALVLDAYFVSNGKRISDFKGGEAELTVSYPTTKPVRVWYVAEDGTKELVPSTFDGKAAKFVVTHFSHYAIEILDGSSYAACPQDNTCVYAKFTDADTKAWYHDGVHYCVENGMMNGVSNTQFAPNGTLTRGMVVTVLARLDGVTITSTGSEWYADGQAWAVANGVSDGTNMTANITREQLATMLYRYAQLKGIDTNKFTENTNTLSHNDVFTISDWATSGMHFCIAAGVVNGDDKGNLNPHSTATRAEAAAMFQRLGEKVLAK